MRLEFRQGRGLLDLMLFDFLLYFSHLHHFILHRYHHLHIHYVGDIGSITNSI